MNIDNKFLLVCLQLIIISLMSLLIGEGVDGRSWSPVESIDGKVDFKATCRNVRLYSRIASKHVIVQDRVSATANSTDCKGIVTLETVAGSEKAIRILGWTDKYLCFNQKGRLVTKPKNRARGPKCEFKETFYLGWSQFRSVINEDWSVGFSGKGKPLLASARASPIHYDFLKDPLNNNDLPDGHRSRHHHGQTCDLHNKRKPICKVSKPSGGGERRRKNRNDNINSSNHNNSNNNNNNINNNSNSRHRDINKLRKNNVG